LDTPVSIIYLLAPNATMLVVKRLQGIGHCIAMKTVVVQNATELPLSAQKDACLVIPEECIASLSENQVKSWAKIFVLTSNPLSCAAFDGAIFVNSLSEPWAIWQKILVRLIESLSLTHLKPSWHTLQSNGSCELGRIGQQLRTSPDVAGIHGCDLVKTILRALDTPPISLRDHEAKYEVFIDANSFKLILTLEHGNDEVLKFFRVISLSPDIGESWLKQDKATSSFCLQVKLFTADPHPVHIFDLGNTHSISRKNWLKKDLEDAS
jgi:hypothetical protein